MSWKIAIVVALLTGLIMAAITAPVADRMTKKMGVSDMEGGRGYAVIGFILLGFVGGLIIGVLTTRMVGAVEWERFWKVEGIALLAGNALLFGISSLCLLGLPRPPLLDGRMLALETDVFLPQDLAPVEAPSARNLRMSLYAGPKDNHYVEIDTAHIRHEGELLVLHALADLNSASAVRMLSLTVDDSTSYTLDMPLRPRPRATDKEWTERLPMRLSSISGNGYTYTRVLVRYRVVPRAEAAP